jgi:choline dehydrogenase-like flavoprotein/pimeloyl-ACP methyl ester carboxylesterase
MNQPGPDKSPASLRWLSADYAVLRQKAPDQVYDVVIVGSGYGGAMAAAEFAGRRKPDGTPVTVCVLERGKEYARGMFPSSLEELPGHVRVHQGKQRKAKTVGRLDGLLDLRVGEEVCAIVGNGLGGTSLINAGVMIEPTLAPGRLPPSLQAALTPEYFAEVKRMLGATDTLHLDHPELVKRPLRKTEELRRIAGVDPAATFEPAAITVQTRSGDPDVPQCTLCGDCMTGCNIGAKKSLDTTLLARAWGKGAEIYTGVSVLRVRRADEGTWLVDTTFTSESVRARHKPMAIHARKVVLAAGTFGSTEILLRSRSSKLRMSLKLGSQFSCNGDNLVAVHDGKHEVHPGSDEWEPLRQRHVGPTITGIVRKNGFLMQEFAVPAPLKRFFDETVTTANLLHKLGDWPWAGASQKKQGLDTAAVDPQAMEKTLLVGLIGHDEAKWKIVLPRARRWRRPEWPVEGQVRVEWGEPKNRKPAAGEKVEDAPKLPQMEADFQAAEQLLRKASPGAGILPNPLWKLLPDSMQFLVQGARGPVLTVHPLGGCPMGTSHLDGVVDHLGQVFGRPGPDGGAPGVHEGLVVLDGSIIPGSLAANPALTIAAVARRAAQHLAGQWGWNAATTKVQVPVNRPVYRPPEACTPPRPVPTEVELIERLAGPAGPYWVELTVGYEAKRVSELTSSATRQLAVREGDSYIRVYPGSKTARTDYLLLKEDERDEAALFKAPLRGSLTISEPSLGLMNAWHVGRTTWSWFRNRGLREIADKVNDSYKKMRGIPNEDPSPKVDWRSFPQSAARAAQQRRFDYDLHVVKVPHAVRTSAGSGLAALAGRDLAGCKRITYGRRANPWRQLTELTLDGFPGAEGQPVLKLDSRFLAGKGVPLLRITKQQNQVVALAEFASLGLAWTRMLISIHLWSFRAPDKALKRKAPAQRLPGEIKGLPPLQQHWLNLEPQLQLPPRREVKALLTQYPHPGSTKPPIVLIHGYSASGNTFTHHTIPEPLARHLWKDGREVWVLDLRTSAGMKSALRPWFFEDAALADIPVAIDYVRKHAGQEVDVFAHCIGAVMLGMALLTDQAALDRFRQVDVRPGGHRPTRYGHQLVLLSSHIRRIVFSQKGPLLVYTDANVLRAYFMRLLRRVLLPDDYQFRVPGTKGIGANLLDRVLSTMVYDDEEYDLENPFSWSKRVRWAGFRHRMDALYARDFTVRNIREETLQEVDELFGPLNLDTVAQAIHFARKNAITDGSGLPFNASRSALKARWPRGGTLSIHGVDNGLADAKSLEILQSAMDYAGVPFEAFPVEGYGHQDCLIGADAADAVFKRVSSFLDAPPPPGTPASQQVVGAAALAIGAMVAAGTAPPVPATAPVAEKPDVTS